MNIGDTFFGGTSKFQNISSISELVSLFLNTAFILSGLILLFFFIMGGIGMISSAGGNDPQKAEQAKKTISSAVIGFVIVFVSYWIVKLISGFLGISDLIF